MKFSHALIVASSIFAASAALANPVRDGRWDQVASSGGHCGNCEIEIVRLTDHIIQIVGNNGWLAYATYDRRRGAYFGSLEWKEGAGGRGTEPYDIELRRSEGRLFLRAESRSGGFTAEYRRDRD